MGHVGPTAKAAWVEDTLARLSTEQLIGQLIIQFVYGTEADQPDPRNLDRYGVATPAEVVAKYLLGGLIYFGWSDNIADPAQVQRLSNGLQRASLATPAGIPLDLSTDQETGRVVRIGPPATEFPGAMALGAGGDPARTRAVFEVTGRELRAMGISTDYAPDADVNVDPDNPVIGVRSFGARPGLVAAHVAAAVEGLHAGGVGAAAKHFPGHGDTGTDSHTALPVIQHTRAQWRELDKPPFCAAIGAGVDEIMTAHIACPELDPSGDPATLSASILQGLLRDELGYDGLVITDSLQMAGVRARYDDAEIAVRALEAGVDLLLMPADPDVAPRAVLEAVRSGRISEDRLLTSVRRVLGMKFDRGLIGRPLTEVGALSAVGCAEHRRVADEAAVAAVSLLRDDRQLLPLGDRPVLVIGTDARPRASLRAALQASGRSARDAALPADIDPADIDPADIVVLLVADIQNHPSVESLVAMLVPTGSLVVVGIKDPSDLVGLTGVGSALLTYSATDVGMRALAAVLTGERRATGRPPVESTLLQALI